MKGVVVVVGGVWQKPKGAFLSVNPLLEGCYVGLGKPGRKRKTRP